MFRALLKLLFILHKFFLFKYSPCEHILQHRLVLELCPHRIALVSYYLIIHGIDRHYLPQLVIDG